MRAGRLSLVAMLVLVSCATAKKLDNIIENGILPVLVPLQDELPPNVSFDLGSRDTVTVVDADGNEMYLMSAVMDEQGEMVANETLNAAVKIASFKNVAERNGKVDLRFSIIVPEALQDGKWQLRFTPELYVLGDTSRLEQVFITGETFRRQQIKGYERYNNFLSTIIVDSTQFIRQHDLKVFLDRNMLGLEKPIFGVMEDEAVEHYTDRLKEWMNQQRISRKDIMFRRYVKSPYVVDGLRLDSIVRSGNGDWEYEYVQTINAAPGLRKAQISLSGTVNDIEHEVMTIPPTEPLAFYISSLSSFVDSSPKYRTKVIARRVDERHSYKIVFGIGKSEIDRSLEENDRQLKDLDLKLYALLDNHEFEIDSMVVCASASPEGSFEMNRALSQRRGRNMCGYINGVMDCYRDSVRREEGVRLALVEMEDDLPRIPEIAVHPVILPENWDMLQRLILTDKYLNDGEKQEFAEIMLEPSPDRRESRMSSTQWFRYVKENLYPKLRTVDMTVGMHRKNMLQDTVLTQEIDSLYMEAVRMVRDRDYKSALAILRPYADFNTAVAYLALDYNASAMSILQSLPRTAAREYLMAIVQSRFGNEAGALQSYLDACAMEASFIHRGNLDPEISSLVRKYQLNTY